MGYQLGVDLGTTYTAAAISRDGRVEMATLGDRSAAIPSVLFLREDGEILVGDAAARRGLTEPDRLAREFKRRLGDPAPLLLGGTPMPADALMGALLGWVVEHVTSREGAPPDHVTVTHPANWGPYKRELLDQAIARAGVREIASTMTEPAAAAVQYASTERLEAGEVVAVYDLGGGTFDAALLRKQADGFELLGRPEGLERTGGIDFDEAVFGHVAAVLGDTLTELSFDDPRSLAGLSRLRADCVAAKEALSSDTDVAIPVFLPTIQTEVRLTRGEFESMIRPTLVDTVAALERARRGAGVDAGDVHAVLLVGGSSRIPLVGELVGQQLGRPVAVDIHPKHAVALGAARGTTAEVDAVAPPVVAAPVVAPPVPPPPVPPAGVPPIAVAAPTPAGDTPEVAAEAEAQVAAMAGAPVVPPPPVGAAAPPGPGIPPTGGPPAKPKAGRGRLYALLGGGVALIVVIALAVVLLGKGSNNNSDSSSSDSSSSDSGETTTLPAPAAVATTNLPDGSGKTFNLATFDVSSTPYRVVTGAGAAWFLATDDSAVLRINPATNQVAAVLAAGSTPKGIAFGAGSVWTADSGTTTVSRMDPASNTTTATISPGHTPLDVAATDTEVWITEEEGHVAKIDPATNSVATTIDTTIAVDQIAIGGGSVWATAPEAKGVMRIDEATGKVSSVVITGDTPSQLAFGAGSLWVSDSGSNVISRIDPAGSKVVATIQMDDTIGGMVVSGTDLIVSLHSQNKVARIDTTTNKQVGTVAVGTAPSGLADGLGTVWVCNTDDHSMTRIAPA